MTPKAMTSAEDAGGPKNVLKNTFRTFSWKLTNLSLIFGENAKK
jgi:hypothetical protein